MSTELARAPSPFAQTVPIEPAAGMGLPALGGDEFKPAEVFRPGGSTGFIRQVRLFVASKDLDISTDAGKDFVRSFAYQLVRTRTEGVKRADELIADDKRHISEVTSERKFFESEMLKIQHEVRGPLTAWEDRDKVRCGAHEQALSSIMDAWMFIGTPTISQIRTRLDMVNGYEGRPWEEFEPRAVEAIQQSRSALEGIMAKAVKAEADRRELEEGRQRIAKLEADAAAQRQRDRDAQIASEAAARATQETEARIRAEAPMSVSGHAALRYESESPDSQAAYKAVTEDRAAPLVIPTEDFEPRDVTVENEIHQALRAVGLVSQTANVVIEAIKAGKIPHVRITY